MANGGVAAVVIGAAALPGFNEKVFSVGPFGNRVGFAFQQERALNLVDALKTSGRITSDSKVAIIGGGLAGVTAKLALQGLGVGQAQLFERTRSLMKVQHAATHRVVHPSYNSWPIADDFSSTTQLPFLNWFSDTASEVSSFINHVWRTRYQDSLGSISMLHHIEKLELQSDTDKIRIFARRLEEQKWVSCDPTDVDMAIIATGFGTEKEIELSDVGSYWIPDAVNHLREDDESPFVIVSGTGDGGLIDCIRFCFSEPKDANLLIAIIALLRHPKYQSFRRSLADIQFERSTWERRIKDLEETASARSVGYLAGKSDFGTDNENAIAQFLADGYTTIVQELPKGVTDLLDGHLVNIDKVTLVGRLVKPFTVAAAPINKLVIAYLLKKRPALYLRGFVETKTGHPEVVRYDGSRSENLSSLNVVLRHGGQPPIYSFIADSAANFALLHKSMSNLTDVGRPSGEFCTHIQNIASGNPDENEFIELRLEDADQFSRKYFGVSLETRGDKTGQSWFVFDDTRPEFRALKARLNLKLGEVPHNLFGVKVLPVSPKLANSSKGKRA